MPKISIAFVLSATLAFLLLRMLQASASNRRAWPFMTLLFAGAVQAFLVALRWDLGFTALRPLQVVLAAAIPALAWVSFRSFAQTQSKIFSPKDVIFLLPAALALVALTVVSDAVDLVIIASFLAFGVACLGLALKGEKALVNASLDGVLDVQRALWLVTFALFSSPVIDVLVMLDFVQNKGARVPSYIGFGNMLWLAAISLAALWAQQKMPEDAETDHGTPTPSRPEAEDHRIAEEVTRKLNEGLMKDPNLSLMRLARRCGIPARQVSQAINRVHQRSVSQYVNEMRIAEACKLMKADSVTVTQAIYESGFQTKSNFNREFLRVMGRTPRAWRKDKLADRSVLLHRP